MYLKRRFGMMLLASAAVIGIGLAQAQGVVPDPEMEYLLDEGSGFIASNTGTAGATADFFMFDWDGAPIGIGLPTDLHSVDGGGLTGQPGDYAFDNTGSHVEEFDPTNYPGEFTYVGGQLGLPGFDPGSMMDFTIAGWIKPEHGTWGEEIITPGDPPALELAPKLFEYWDSGSHNYTLNGYGGQYEIPVNAPGFTTDSKKDKIQLISDVEMWDVPEDWNFFAITHEGNTGDASIPFDGDDFVEVKFYSGSKTTPVTLKATISAEIFTNPDYQDPEIWPTPPDPFAHVVDGGATFFGFGNDRNGIHAFDGLMDNLRIWGSDVDSDVILDLAQLEEVRTGDAGAVVIPGDADGDGDVDGNDFLAWQSNFPTISGATLAQGDFDGNGTVDGNDFLTWQSNFPYPNAPALSDASVSVPEPATMALLGLGGLAMLRRRRGS